MVSGLKIVPTQTGGPIDIRGILEQWNTGIMGFEELIPLNEWHSSDKKLDRAIIHFFYPIFHFCAIPAFQIMADSKLLLFGMLPSPDSLVVGHVTY